MLINFKEDNFKEADIFWEEDDKDVYSDFKYFISNILEMKKNNEYKEVIIHVRGVTTTLTSQTIEDIDSVVTKFKDVAKEIGY